MSTPTVSTTTVPTRPVRGWAVVARKEFADHVHSARLAVVAAVLAIAALGAVAAAAGTLRDAAPSASQDAAVFLRLFVIEIGGTPFSFATFVALIGPLLGVAFGFDAINAERADRTLPRLLAQPIHRDEVIVGKFVAGMALVAVVLAALVAVTGAVGVLRLGVTPDADQVARLLLWTAVSVVYIGLWLAFAIVCSVHLRRAATAALVALSVWVVLSLFATFLVGLLADAIAPLPTDGADPTLEQLRRNVQVERWLSTLLPGAVYGDATSALLTPEVRTLGFSLSVLDPRALPSALTLGGSLAIVWPQVLGLLAGTAVLFAVAYVGFMRDEVRA